MSRACFVWCTPNEKQSKSKSKQSPKLIWESPGPLGTSKPPKLSYQKTQIAWRATHHFFCCASVGAYIYIQREHCKTFRQIEACFLVGIARSSLLDLNSRSVPNPPEVSRGQHFLILVPSLYGSRILERGCRIEASLPSPDREVNTFCPWFQVSIEAESSRGVVESRPLVQV